MTDLETTLWIVAPVITLMGIIWGSHRYINGRVDNLNTAVSKDVADFKDKTNADFNSIKELISGKEKELITTLAEFREVLVHQESCKDDREEIVKAVEKFNSIYASQLLTYLRLGGYRLGMLLNFGNVYLRDGVQRVVNRCAEG